MNKISDQYRSIISFNKFTQPDQQPDKQHTENSILLYIYCYCMYIQVEHKYWHLYLTICLFHFHQIIYINTDTVRIAGKHIIYAGGFSCNIRNE